MLIVHVKQGNEVIIKSNSALEYMHYSNGYLIKGLND